MSRFEPRSMHGNLPVHWADAYGTTVVGRDGRKFIDFTSGIFVANVGHGNARVSKAIREPTFFHSYTFQNDYREEFVEKLVEMTPDYLQKVMLLSSGTEATECAKLLLRLYPGPMPAPNYFEALVSHNGCMHGRTMGALELRRGNHRHTVIPVQDMVVWQKRNSKRAYAFMIESYEGWSGKLWPKEYIQEICAYAKSYGALICFDEIQSGLGRTGKFFCFEHYEVEPDLVCMGKGLAGGLPLSCVIGRKEIMDAPDVGEMSSTHSGNPVCCSAGIAVLEEIEKKDLVAKSENYGKHMHALLQEMKGNILKEVNGKGLMAGLIVPTKEIARDICMKCMDKGLLVVFTNKPSVKLGTPLIISDRALSSGLEILREVLNDLGN